MTIVVVGGSAQGVGKTALVCGLLRALPEFPWTAVKVTSHDHGAGEAIWEEMTSGQGTDTARYLAAGASHAFLITAGDSDLPQKLDELWARLDPDPHVIFESNRILQYVHADLCLAAEWVAETTPQPFFRFVAHQKHAALRLAELDSVSQEVTLTGVTPLFYLAAFERTSLPMQRWLRNWLSAGEHNKAGR